MSFFLGVFPKNWHPIVDDWVDPDIKPEFNNYFIIENFSITEYAKGQLTAICPINILGLELGRYIAVLTISTTNKKENETEKEIDEILFVGKITEINEERSISKGFHTLKKITAREIGADLPPLILWQDSARHLQARFDFSSTFENIVPDRSCGAFEIKNQKYYWVGTKSPQEGTLLQKEFIKFLMEHTNYRIPYEISITKENILPPLTIESSDTFETLLQKISPTIAYTYYYDKSNKKLKLLIYDKSLKTTEKDNQILKLKPDNSIYRCEILRKEKHNDAIALRGRRHLHYFSIATLAPKDTLRLLESWTEEEADYFANPQKTLWPCTLNELDERIKTGNESETLRKLLQDQQKMTAEQIEEAVSRYASQKKDELLNSLGENRKLYPHIICHYSWPGADPTNLEVPGPALLTCRKPGNLHFIRIWESNLSSEAISCFPTVRLMDYDADKYYINDGSFYKDTEDEQKLVKFDEIKKLIRKNNMGDYYPLISDSAGNHQTPLKSDLKFENRTISFSFVGGEIRTKVAVGQAKSLTIGITRNEPRCFYRSFGRAIEIADNEYTYDECWRSNDLQGAGVISFRFSYDRSGIKIDSPAPEQFCWSDDSIFEIGYGVTANYDTTKFIPSSVKKYNVFDKGYALAKYDPDRVFYASKTHWLRLVFQVAGYSSQKLILFVGDLTKAKNPRIIDDESFFCEFVNAGYVPCIIDDSSLVPEEYQELFIFTPTPSIDGQPRAIVPVYTRNYLLINHNLEAAEAYFMELLNYWGRDRFSYRVTAPIFSATGAIMKYQIDEKELKLRVLGRHLIIDGEKSISPISEQKWDFGDSPKQELISAIPPPPIYKEIPRRL